ncbi:Uncharacterised protein [Yersinia intermedia]|uniref:Uncharacterized protein n=1 Tax=Yersinia intermedia TaxID=631 RepID=A0A0H5LZA9_YERIN|nr:Uncharacterised protein [Yersinia intermedia]
MRARRKRRHTEQGTTSQYDDAKRFILAPEA